MENETNHGHDYNEDNDRRRTIRIHRSGLKHSQLEQLDRPSLKFAETKDELEQTFRLIYDVYLKRGIIPHEKKHKMTYNIHYLLPSTTHIIAKSYDTVISNLTEMFDNAYFGLPMDSLYKKEVDVLRKKGRKIVELSGLATPKEHRWKNIFHYLVQVMYWFSLYSDVDDVCVTVNPRHVRYYMYLFPFEQFGQERYYERVGAPAIALRGKVKESREKMQKICDSLGFDTSLKYYFKRMANYEFVQSNSYMEKKKLQIVIKPNKLDEEVVKHFIDLDPNILSGLSKEQIDKLLDYYPDLELGDFDYS